MNDGRQIYRGENLEFRAVPEAVAWLSTLRGKAAGRVAASLRVVDRMIIIGGDCGGRLCKVHGTGTALLVLRATRRGAGPPHLRLLCIRRDNVIWILHGFIQRHRALPKSAIKVAELRAERLEHDAAARPRARRAGSSP
jgi:hypothetical protein